MKSGDQCASCERGVMRVANTITTGEYRRQYLKCNSCGATGKDAFRIDRAGQRVVVSRPAKALVRCPCCGVTIDTSTVL